MPVPTEEQKTAAAVNYARNIARHIKMMAGREKKIQDEAHKGLLESLDSVESAANLIVDKTGSKLLARDGKTEPKLIAALDNALALADGFLDVAKGKAAEHLLKADEIKIGATKAYANAAGQAQRIKTRENANAVTTARNDLSDANAAHTDAVNRLQALNKYKEELTKAFKGVRAQKGLQLSHPAKVAYQAAHDIDRLSLPEGNALFIAAHSKSNSKPNLRESLDKIKKAAQNMTNDRGEAVPVEVGGFHLLIETLLDALKEMAQKAEGTIHAAKGQPRDLKFHEAATVSKNSRQMMQRLSEIQERVNQVPELESAVSKTEKAKKAADKLKEKGKSFPSLMYSKDDKILAPTVGSGKGAIER